MSDSGARSSITHKNGANNNFDALIQSIDVARQDFVTECDLMREFSRASMGIDAFREFVDEVYNVEEDQVFRKREKLWRAYNGGFGAEFHINTLWGCVNAVTQVETSTLGKTAKGMSNTFNRANFGAGLTLSRKAIEVAKDYLTVC